MEMQEDLRICQRSPKKKTQLAHATEQRCLADADAARIVQKPPDFSQSTPTVVASGSQDVLAQRENETQLANATEQRSLAVAPIVQKPPDFSQSTASLVASGSQNPLAQL